MAGLSYFATNIFYTSYSVFQVAELEQQSGHTASSENKTEDLFQSVEDMEALLKAKDEVRAFSIAVNLYYFIQDKTNASLLLITSLCTYRLFQHSEGVFLKRVPIIQHFSCYLSNSSPLWRIFSLLSD